MLEHLVVYPRGGLGNRMRAIASARRISSRTGARCTVVWDWGDYHALFDQDTEWMPYSASMDWKQNRLVPGYHHIRHLHPDEGGRQGNWRVPVTSHPRVCVTSWYVFYEAEERPPRRVRLFEAPVAEWLPQPHPTITEAIERFRAERLPAGTVGMHIRRTDNKRAIARSPDRAFFAEADRLAAAGRSIFLATDNLETLRVMQQRYGDSVIHYPKRSNLEHRWPRSTHQPLDIADDMIDLWLLSSCDYVIGSLVSSYSRIAVLLNGSSTCKLLDRPLARLRKPIGRIWQERVRRPLALTPDRTTGEKIFGLRPAALERAVELLEHEDPVLTAALSRLVASADAVLSERPASVAEQPEPAVSVGERYDRRRLTETLRAAEALALAYRLTGNDAYGEHSASRLRTWFLDPATRMNPQLEFAQVIPGHNRGGSDGVLDGQYLLPGFDAGGLLRGSPHWSDQDQRELVEWAGAFLVWLRTSKNGKTEAKASGEHGTWYDVQVTHLALLVGDTRLAQQTVARAKKRRIARQIRPDGSQPRELERAQPFLCLQQSLDALFELATRAERAGIDLWHYETSGGAGIRKALDYVVLHLEDPARPWPYRGERQMWAPFYAVLHQAGRVYEDERYVNVLRDHPDRAAWDLVDLIR